MDKSVRGQRLKRRGKGINKAAALDVCFWTIDGSMEIARWNQDNCQKHYFVNQRARAHTPGKRTLSFSFKICRLLLYLLRLQRTLEREKGYHYSYCCDDLSIEISLPACTVRASSASGRCRSISMFNFSFEKCSLNKWNKRKHTKKLTGIIIKFFLKIHMNKEDKAVYF